jgi:hypothetical protein
MGADAERIILKSVPFNKNSRLLSDESDARHARITVAVYEIHSVGQEHEAALLELEQTKYTEADN